MLEGCRSFNQTISDWEVSQGKSFVSDDQA
jgi:hypothetical protein